VAKLKHGRYGEAGSRSGIRSIHSVTGGANCLKRGDRHPPINNTRRYRPRWAQANVLWAIHPVEATSRCVGVPHQLPGRVARAMT